MIVAIDQTSYISNESLLLNAFVQKPMDEDMLGQKQLAIPSKFAISRNQYFMVRVDYILESDSGLCRFHIRYHFIAASGRL